MLDTCLHSRLAEKGAGGTPVWHTLRAADIPASFGGLHRDSEHSSPAMRRLPLPLSLREGEARVYPFVAT